MRRKLLQSTKPRSWGSPPRIAPSWTVFAGAERRKPLDHRVSANFAAFSNLGFLLDHRVRSDCSRAAPRLAPGLMIAVGCMFMSGNTNM